MALRHMKERFSGEYRIKKLGRIEADLVHTRRILSRTTDQILSAYLVKKLEILEREETAAKLGFFIGKNLARRLLGVQASKSQTPYYDLICSVFGQDGRLALKDIFLPVMLSSADKKVFANEFGDIMFPYLLGDLCEELTYIEGPYELCNHVYLRENDVVIDCGANIGMFSAVSSAKGCKVYAFEPMNYIIDNYLSKTAEWNKNITVCPYALADEKKDLLFELYEGNIGASRESTNLDRQGGRQYQQVRAVSLDDFVSENGLDQVDFIKADIEGAERYMLLGAKNTIRKFSPKISICTYHLPDDPQVLREILLDIQPKYKIVEKYMKMYAYLP